MSTLSTRKTDPGMQYRVRRMSAMRGLGHNGSDAVHVISAVDCAETLIDTQDDS